ncbi:MAG: hypothetical protein ABI315_09370 [Bacteroidia bacterium]
MKIIRHIFIALLTIIILYVGLMYFLKHIKYNGRPITYITNNYYGWKGGDTYEKFIEFFNSKSYDIVFVGSSRAYRGYSPFIFESSGYKSFNLGTSAQSIKNTYFVIKNYINKSNCKVLVVDVFAGSFKQSQLESSSDLIENLNNSKAAYDIAVNNKDIRAINMLTLRYLTNNDLPYFNKTDYIGKGYSVTNDSLSPAKRQIVIKNEKVIHEKFEIDKEQLDYFKKIVELCALKKIKVVFVYSPISYFYDYSVHAPFIKMIIPIMKSYNDHFYDFSKCNGINTLNHFYDDSHLNQKGVEVFNKVLIEQLERDHVILQNNESK